MLEDVSSKLYDLSVKYKDDELYHLHDDVKSMESTLNSCGKSKCAKCNSWYVTENMYEVRGDFSYIFACYCCVQKFLLDEGFLSEDLQHIDTESLDNS